MNDTMVEMLKDLCHWHGGVEEEVVLPMANTIVAVMQLVVDAY